MTWAQIAKGGIQTGRTTRMMARAEQLAREGRAVYVITHTVDFARELIRTFQPSPSIHVEAWNTCYLDVESMRLIGAHPNCVVLIDHGAIEMRFGRLLEELHRYDLQS